MLPGVLDVSNTLFYGELDGSIFKPLQKLLYLELGGNMYNSSLPQEIATLPDLEALYIYDTGLEGDLEFLSDVGPMYELWMDDNPYLVGTIPSEIGTLTTLASLSISNCDLWGQIPTEVGHLTLLEQIWLFGNWLSGTVPTEFGKLSELQVRLCVASFSMLVESKIGCCRNDSHILCFNKHITDPCY